jgi:hypothetical protein
MDLVFAYLDPGSISIAFQAVVAGLIAIPVLFRNRISSAFRAIRGGSGEPKETVAEPTSHDAASR